MKTCQDRFTQKDKKSQTEMRQRQLWHTNWRSSTALIWSNMFFACFLHVFCMFLTCFYNMFQCSSGASGCPNRTLGKASMLASRRCALRSPRLDSATTLRLWQGQRHLHRTHCAKGLDNLDTMRTQAPQWLRNGPAMAPQWPHNGPHANTTGVTSGGVLEETHRAKSDS